MVELSIIVPIYNVERYLDRCVESILHQTFIDFELILVDDGSPDRCPEIIDEYQKKDYRIVVIHQENKGVSAARNAGLKLARGKYIGFVDPDDYIESCFYENLIRCIELYHVDIACCNWNSFYESGKKKTHEVSIVSDVMSMDTFLEHLFDSPRSIGGSNCNKVFLREMISEGYDENLTIGEDNDFLVRYCLNCNSAYFLNEANYHILERSDSAIRKNPLRVAESLDARFRMIQLLASKSKKIKRLAEKDFLDCAFSFKRTVVDSKDDKKYVELAVKYWNEYMDRNLLKVLFNSEIYWKTRLMYLISFFRK